jgi:hypothetical protein
MTTSKSKRARPIKPRSKARSKAGTRENAAHHQGTRPNSKQARVLALLRRPIARAITGTAWSGPRFFALQRAGDGSKPKRRSAAAPEDGRRQRRAAIGRNDPHAMNGSSPALRLEPASHA